MRNPLRQFVDERREAKLAKAKPDAVAKIESDFQFDNWVQSAADRASQVNVATHIGTLTHPDAKIAPFIANCEAAEDGYVRTGNVQVDWDAFGNAAALDTLAFLRVELSDSRPALEHLREGTAEVRQLFDFADDRAYERLRGQFLQILANSKPYPITCSEIKQVYFPLPDGGYHLLSLVSSTGLMRENRIRLQHNEWGEDAKTARELQKQDRKQARESQPLSEPDQSQIHYQTIPERGSIKLGGANAQNISSMNAECKGVWPLFASYRTTPSEYQQLPKRDYFRSLRWDSYSRVIFNELHQIFWQPSPGNLEQRESRKRWLEELWLWASGFALQLQRIPGNWSTDKTNQLPSHQKVWLDVAQQVKHKKEKSWRRDVANDFSHWVLNTYKKMNWGDRGPQVLAALELSEFRSEVSELPFNAREWQSWER
ncbi:type I-F CRISPR-associated protein Csy1 [Roseiconus lacunae]|uniref:type I-F CRISPR-associated protein Csy1 n=1 Tax=Roseiconus lacunae TaxID=2605694 RepID=UPI001E294ACD|nr:type I-F CRISPR-associated protein Csy1 [Roseiconus lacunae]MCD0461980.1 type I-F CRISPR-associated protein Csy1 [Roseiconus lacunae]